MIRTQQRDALKRHCGRRLKRVRYECRKVYCAEHNEYKVTASTEYRYCAHDGCTFVQRRDFIYDNWYWVDVTLEGGKP